MIPDFEDAGVLMRRFRFLLLVLPIAIVCFAADCGHSQTKKNSNSRKNKRNRQSKSRRGKQQQRPQFHPVVEAVFRLPGQIVPSEEQTKGLNSLKKQYGPKLQTLLPYLMAGKQIDRQNKAAKQGNAFEQKMRRRLSRLRSVKDQRQLKILKKQISEAKKEAKKLEREIQEEIASLLTSEQRKTIRDNIKKSLPKTKKKKKKKSNNA